jgi:hypothetical protein
MKRIVETERETRLAVDRFRDRIRELGGKPQNLEWGFPDGHRDNYPTFTLRSKRGDIHIGVPTSWTGRVAHLLRFVKPGGPPSPDVEINIPNKLNRSVSGVYVVTNDSLWLCTRGAFTAFRGQIPRETTLRYFQKWLIDVQDCDREAKVIPVAALDSETLADYLAEFIQTVIDLKTIHKSGDEPSSDTTLGWHSGEEFEGLKRPTKSGAAEAYEYTHGPLCNGLFRCLKSLLASRRDLAALKNWNIDAAVVHRPTQRARIIFEVKTTAELGGQIYSAIGQRLSYRHFHGSDECTIALVVPRQCEKDAKNLSAFLESLHIHVIVGDGSTYTTLAGQSLRDFVTDHADA